MHLHSFSILYSPLDDLSVSPSPSLSTAAQQLQQFTSSIFHTPFFLHLIVAGYSFPKTFPIFVVWALKIPFSDLAFHFGDNGIDVLSLVPSMSTTLQDRISSGEISLMEFSRAKDLESRIRGGTIEHEFWPLEQVDPEKARFPCCVVWTPLPIVSWLAPFIGHVGICKEDGTILDFTGSNLVNVNDYAFGPVARYLQLDREQCCFPPNPAAHKCKHRYVHAEFGTEMTWDDAIQSSSRRYEHKSYNLLTCNCHSFVAHCLNRLAYGGSMKWNMVNVAALILVKGKWVDGYSVLRSSMPFMVVFCLGIFMVGWPFMIGLFSFSLLLIAWFLLSTYVFKNMIVDC